MNAPNMRATIAGLAQENPQEWRDAHREGVSRERAEAFIRIAASRLHSVNPNFGLNGKRGTTTISQDVLSFKSDHPVARAAGGVEIIDVILGAGGPNPRAAWNDVTQATVDAGTVGRFIQPDVQVPDPEPEPLEDPILDFPLEHGHDGTTSYRWFRDNHDGIDEAIRQWFADTHGGRVPTGTRAIQHITWRALREFPRFGNTLREVLQQTWAKAAPPPPLPGEPLPDLLSMPLNDRVGNFLWTEGLYFPPAAIHHSEDKFRRVCVWNRQMGYKLLLVNWEQTDWAPGRGYPAEWTRGARVDNFQTMDGMATFIRRLRIAIDEYGLYPVVGVFEQDTVRDRDWAHLERMANMWLPVIEPHCVAFWDTWEVDEVMDPADQHRLTQIIDNAVGKSHGLHFANIRRAYLNEPEYWESNPSDLVWLQYGFRGTTRASIREDTRNIVRNLAHQKAVMAEASMWGPSPWVDGNGYTIGEAGVRGLAGIDGGAVARMNG